MFPLSVRIFGTSIVGGMGAYLAYKEYILHRFVNHDLQQNVVAQLQAELDPNLLQVIEKLRQVRHFTWNVLVPTSLGTQMVFHFLRLFEHHSQRLVSRNVLIMLLWSVIPTMYLSVLPNYLYVYSALLPRDQCQQVIYKYAFHWEFQVIYM